MNIKKLFKWNGKVKIFVAVWAVLLIIATFSGVFFTQVTLTNNQAWNVLWSNRNQLAKSITYEGGIAISESNSTVSFTWAAPFKLDSAESDNGGNILDFVSTQAIGATQYGLEARGTKVVKTSFNTWRYILEIDPGTNLNGYNGPQELQFLGNIYMTGPHINVVIFGRLTYSYANFHVDTN